MAIRILTPGEPQQYIIKCPQCGCTFIYQKADTQDIAGEAYRHVECPMVECKNLIRVDWVKYDYNKKYFN